MRLYWNYFCLELKRGRHLLFKMMAAMCLLLGVLVAGVSIAAFFLREGLILDKTKVAIVVPKEEHKTKFLVQYASTMDSVEELC